MNKAEKDRKKLRTLAQLMFNRGREKIENEIRNKLKVIMRPTARGVYSGKVFGDAISLHIERIDKFLNLKLKIYKEVFLNDQPVKTKNEINSIMEDLEKIANSQKHIILSDAGPIIKRFEEPKRFKEMMERNVAKLLSKIKIDLTIEKDKQILLRKKEVEKVGSKTEEIQEFKELLKSINNKKLREILLRDFNNAIFCIKNELWKPCVILCGGILEGVFNIEFEIEKITKDGKTVEMTLENMIDKAKNMGILPKKHDANLAHAVRAFRNYVHIKKEIKDNRLIDDTDAYISINVVKKLFRIIEKFKESQKKIQK